MIADVFLILRPTTIHFDLPKYVFWIAWLAFLALIVLVLWTKSRGFRQRREALSNLAMQSGYEFIEKPDATRLPELADIQIQQPRTAEQSFKNVLRGSYSGNEAILADAMFGYGKNRTFASVMAFKFQEPFPSFYLVPETLLWRLIEKLGNKDIDFADAPEFSKKFFLHGQDEAAIRQLFTRDLTLAFESGISADLFVCASGKWLVVYHPNQLLPVAKIPELKQRAESVAETFRKVRRHA